MLAEKRHLQSRAQADVVVGQPFVASAVINLFGPEPDASPDDN